MKHRLKPLAVSLCILGLISAHSVVFAANHSSGSTSRSQCQANHHHHCSSDDYESINAASLYKNKQALARQQAVADCNQPEISGPADLPTYGLQYLPIDLDVPGQSFVSTGPYIGVPLQYAGNNLIINTPSINEDVSLLTLRKNINARMEALGLKHEGQHSHLLLSGIVEAQANYKNLRNGPKNAPNSSDIDLTSAGIDAYILGPSTWTSALISLSYDNSIGANEGSLNNYARSQNSRVFVNKAFIVVGDFSKCPIYGTIGQMYVPFGVYSSNMISSPLTKLLARTQERAILLGFQQQSKNAFYGSVYVYRGDSYAATRARINSGGINGGVLFNCCDKVSGNFGLGLISNIADSQGMQNTGYGETTPANVPLVFGGFGGEFTGNEHLQHTVPAGNVHALLSLCKEVDLLAEYIAATRSFSTRDLTMNGHGARPQAIAVEAAYTFQGTVKPISVAAGYGMTRDALALGLPIKRWSAVLNTSIWRNTLQSLEFRHDVNYGNNSTSTGSLLPGPAPGGSDNLVTAEFDIYF